jgi:hypothetical protein
VGLGKELVAVSDGEGTVTLMSGCCDAVKAVVRDAVMVAALIVSIPLSDAAGVGAERLKVPNDEIVTGDTLDDVVFVGAAVALRDGVTDRATVSVCSDRDAVLDVPGVAVSLSWMDEVGVVDALREQVRDNAGEVVRLDERRE